MFSSAPNSSSTPGASRLLAATSMDAPVEAPGCCSRSLGFLPVFYRMLSFLRCPRSDTDRSPAAPSVFCSRRSCNLVHRDRAVSSVATCDVFCKMRRFLIVSVLRRFVFHSRMVNYLQSSTPCAPRPHTRNRPDDKTNQTQQTRNMGATYVSWVRVRVAFNTRTPPRPA